MEHCADQLFLVKQRLKQIFEKSNQTSFEKILLTTTKIQACISNFFLMHGLTIEHFEKKRRFKYLRDCQPQTWKVFYMKVHRLDRFVTCHLDKPIL